MKCPVDKATLEKSVYENNVEIDSCQLCHGVWLDKGELEKIQESQENDYSDELEENEAYLDRISGAYQQALKEKPRDLHCPKCDGMLIEKEYGYSSQIYIDVCLACEGIWLDAGELKALEVFYERQKQKEPQINISSPFFSRLVQFFLVQDLWKN